MRKKIMIIVGIVLVCSVCGVIAFFQLQPKLVSGEKTKLQKIVITDYGPGESETIQSITTIEDPQEMHALYDDFRRVAATKSNEMESPFSMMSPHYTVVFYYLDKEDEVLVYSREAGRYLGEPDWYAVSKAARILRIVESVV